MVDFDSNILQDGEEVTKAMSDNDRRILQEALNSGSAKRAGTLRVANEKRVRLESARSDMEHARVAVEKAEEALRRKQEDYRDALKLYNANPNALLQDKADFWQKEINYWNDQAAKARDWSQHSTTAHAGAEAEFQFAQGQFEEVTTQCRELADRLAQAAA